jgi:hypothetical protein
MASISFLLLLQGNYYLLSYTPSHYILRLSYIVKSFKEIGGIAKTAQRKHPRVSGAKIPQPKKDK